MRFRSFGHFPSFGSYLAGHSFWKTAAYGVAAGLGRACGSLDELRARNARAERRLELKMSLMHHGILPYPGETKLAAVPRREVAMAAVRASVPAAPAPDDWRPTPKPVQIAPKARPVIPDRSVCADPWQSQPAAVSSRGGLRGSSATRWRR